MKSGKQLTMLEAQERALALLNCLDCYCAEHDLTYFLVGGSLIGAVRNQDLVAWDDDIDVAMHRSDYERFISEFEDTEQYRLVHINRTQGCVYSMAKLVDTGTSYVEKYIDAQDYMGVFIDIFPLDGMREGDIAFVRRCNFLVNLYRFGFALSAKASVGKPFKETIRRIVRVLLAPIGRVRFFSYVEHVFQSKTGPWVFNGWGAWGAKECGPSSWFSGTVSVELRGRQYLAPVGYDAWLTKVYGDYMTPPSDPSYSHGEFYIRSDIDETK